IGSRYIQKNCREAAQIFKRTVGMRKASTGLRVKQSLPLSPPQPRQLKNPEFPAPNNKSDLILTHNNAGTQGCSKIQQITTAASTLLQRWRNAENGGTPHGRLRHASIDNDF
ncbi:hypothetical protein, partial [Trueperella pyogenes]